MRVGESSRFLFFNESFLIYKDIYSNLVQVTLFMPEIKTRACRSYFASGHPIASSGGDLIVNYCMVFSIVNN